MERPTPAKLLVDEDGVLKVTRGDEIVLSVCGGETEELLKVSEDVEVLKAAIGQVAVC